jgi:hypothetical protein
MTLHGINSLIENGSRYISIGMLTTLCAAQPTNYGSIPGDSKEFPLLESIQIVCGAQQPPYHSHFLPE